MVESAKDRGIVIRTSFEQSLLFDEGFARLRIVHWGFTERTLAMFRHRKSVQVHPKFDHAMKAVVPYPKKDLMIRD